jgi:purine nucleosidase
LKKIIIDTDPGQDDAIALMTAFGSDHLEILGVTCVAGNVPLHLTSENALKISELSGMEDIPVFKGSERPLERDLVTAEHVHGRTGLDGTELINEKKQLEKLDAVSFIENTVLTHESKTITLCALGPLTNLAKVIIKNPQVSKHIKEIVLMGGGFLKEEI